MIAFPRKGPPGPRRVASRDSSQARWPLPGRPRAPHGSGLLQGRARTPRRPPVFPVCAAGPLGEERLEARAPGAPMSGPGSSPRRLPAPHPGLPSQGLLSSVSGSPPWPRGTESKGGEEACVGKGLPLASKRRPSGLEVQAGVGRGPSRPQLPSGWWTGDCGVWLQFPAPGHLLLGVGD